MEQRWVRYNPKLKQIARKLRNNMTLSEILLWKKLKGKQLLGYDFHRQKPVGEYVVDFYCPCLKLVIEIDGDSHDGKEEADSIRQGNLESQGLTIMRFADTDVKRNIHGVVEALREWIIAHATHPKSPLNKVLAIKEGTSCGWVEDEKKFVYVHGIK
jgi:very-short-patch-repair endonuclease